MKQKNVSIFSLMGVWSVGMGVLGLALVFFFGGESRGVVYGETTDIPATTTDTESPSKPSGLSAVIQNGKVMLSWHPSSDNVGVSGYALYRNESFMVTVTGTSFTDTGVQVGSSYQYAVKAGDFSGNKSDMSSSATVTIPTTTTTAPTTTTTTPVTTTIPTTTSTSSSSHVTIGDGTAPDRPSRISAKIIDNRTVQLEWSASSDAVGVVGYRLFRNGTFLTSVTGTTYADRSVYEGQEYRYSVDAKDATGNTSARSEEKRIFIPRLTLQTGTTTANTTWTVENNGETLIVRDSAGEVIPGKKIVNPSVETVPPVMDGVAKDAAAKSAIKEAIRTGL